MQRREMKGGMVGRRKRKIGRWRMVMAVILAILVLLPVVAVVVLLEVLFLPAAVSRAAGKGPRCYPEALKVDYVA